jgi:hypothetical protein
LGYVTVITSNWDGMVQELVCLTTEKETWGREGLEQSERISRYCLRARNLVSILWEVEEKGFRLGL